MTEIRERPILFSGDMVRAILEGRKTQTRRVIKSNQRLPSYFGPAGDTQDLINWGYECEAGTYAVLARDVPESEREECWSLPCPYGAPGDRLWVRETWCQAADPITSKTTDRVLYRATDECEFLDDGDGFPVENKDGSYKSPWRPSIHMPRWACRLVLEVTDVRVERLRGIHWTDMVAEGVNCPAHDFSGGFCCSECPDRRLAFARLWDSINKKKHPWESNPWVWVVEFRKVEA